MAANNADFKIKKGLIVTEGITLGGHTFDDIDITSEASDADDHLMTALAIKNRIEDYNYSTTAGTVTSVTAGTGMTQSGTSTVNPTLNVIGGTGITANADDVAITAAQTGITSVLNSSLKVGYGASDAYINFGTDNQIDFAVDNATQLVLSDGAIYPPTDSDVDLGTSLLRFKDTFVDTLTATSTVTLGTDIVHAGETTNKIGFATGVQSFTIGGSVQAMITDAQLTVAGSLTLEERANAPADNAGFGQLWVKNDGDGELYFTDDNGTDIQLTDDGAIVSSGGIASLAADTSPQLGGDLDVDGNDIVSTSNGPIDINPHGTGKVRINTTSTDGVKLDVRSDNNSTTANFRNQTSVTNSAQTVIQLIAGTTGTAAAGLGAKLQFRQGDDGYAGYAAGAIYSSRVDNSNHDLVIAPQGTGDVSLGNFTFDADQSVGSGQDNYVLTYDHSNTHISLEAAGGGGASEITDLSNATTTASSVWLGSTPANATDYNTAVGIGALDSPNGTNGTKNVAIGQNAGTANTEGFKNVFIGFASGTANTDADHNVFVGSQSGKANTTGVRNIAIGSDSYDAADTENDNIAIGYAALGGAIAGGEKNVAIGNYSGDAITSADQNTLIGHYAGSGITTSNQNVAIGYDALKTLSTGSRSIAIGYEALKTNTGGLNIGIGWLSMANEGAGQNNVAIGDMTMQQTENANNNVVMGNFAGYGDSSGSPTDSGDGNTAIGHYAMQYWKQGDYNTCLGYEAYKGTSNTANGDKNISIGWTAGNNLTSGSGNVVIGAADVPSATGDDQLSISSGDGDVTWITGDSNGGIASKAQVVAVTGTTQLTAAQSGSYVYVTGSGAVELPDDATTGLQYTIFNNKGSNLTVTLGNNNSIVSNWASVAAVADNDATSFVCVSAGNWVQVGA